MIKKISALVLALVLCVTAVAMPVSALENGKTVGYRIELDADSYTAGSKVTVKLYMEFAEDKEWGAGSVIFGMNDVFVETKGGTDTGYMIDDIKATVTHNDAFTSTYKTPAENATWAWVTASTIVNNCINNSSEASYEKFLKLTVAKNTGGSHEFAGNTKRGITGAELNADTEPYVSFQLTLAEDLADNTAILVGIPSGSLQGSYSYMQYYTNPGSSTAGTKIKAADCDLTASVATATVGTAGLGVSYWKDQIRFQADNAGAYAGKFDYRMLATIDGFADIFDDVADAKDTSDNDGILEAGFIFSKSGTVDKDTAIAQINGGAATYSAVTNAYVSKSFGGKEYVMACYVGGIADADVDTALSALGYVKYMVDGETKVATFDAAQTSTFRTLYDKNASNKPA